MAGFVFGVARSPASSGALEGACSAETEVVSAGAALVRALVTRRRKSDAIPQLFT